MAKKKKKKKSLVNYINNSAASVKVLSCLTDSQCKLKTPEKAHHDKIPLPLLLLITGLLADDILMHVTRKWPTALQPLTDTNQATHHL